MTMRALIADQAAQAALEADRVRLDRTARARADA